MQTNLFYSIARKAAKKIFKSGLFYDLEIDRSNLMIRYTDTHGNLYTWQTTPEDQIGGYFTVGKVHTWTERMPTYESEYYSLGNVERSKYAIKFIQHTDNPDYILRASLSYLLPTI
jgi:hypothetical protein